MRPRASGPDQPTMANSWRFSVLAFPSGIGGQTRQMAVADHPDGIRLRADECESRRLSRRLTRYRPGDVALARLVRLPVSPLQRAGERREDGRERQRIADEPPSRCSPEHSRMTVPTRPPTRPKPPTEFRQPQAAGPCERYSRHAAASSNAPVTTAETLPAGISRIFIIRETRSVCRDCVVELRGFEPLTSSARATRGLTRRRFRRGGPESKARRRIQPRPALLPFPDERPAPGRFPRSRPESLAGLWPPRSAV
jgi:hypothetical protein